MKRIEESDGEHWFIECPLDPVDLDLITSGGTPSLLNLGGYLNSNTARIIRQNLEIPRMFVWPASPAAINELIRISSLKHLRQLKSLREGWLDGVNLTEAEHAELRQLMPVVSIREPCPP